MAPMSEGAGKTDARTLPLAVDGSSWSIFTIVVTILAILKGLRFPILWGATQLQFGYQFGFVKRGALGALLRFLHIPVNRYWVFACVAYLLLLITIVVMVSFVRRGTDPRTRVWIPVFASSFAVTYLVSLTGYLDLVLIAITVPLLQMRQSIARSLLDYGVCASAVFVHEEFAITLFPLLWFARVLERPQTPVQFIHLIALPLAVVAGSLVLAWYPAMTPAQMQFAQRAITASVDFPPMEEFFRVMDRSLADNVRIMLSKYRNLGWWFDEVAASLTLLWVAAFFCWRAIRLLERGYLRTLVVVVSLLPAGMQLVGWDIYRWYALSALVAFCAYLLVAQHTAQPARDRASDDAQGRDAIAVLLLVGLNLFSSAGMFDSFQGNSFPFTDPVKSLIGTFRKTGHLPIPIQNQ